MTATPSNRLGRALHAFHLFTLVTTDPTSPYYSTYTAQFSVSGRRVS